MKNDGMFDTTWLNVLYPYFHFREGVLGSTQPDPDFFFSSVPFDLGIREGKSPIALV